jgi:UDP:flavonoid glycosyltransferase YjiC (YdhE family)
LGFSRDFILNTNRQEANAIDDFKPDVVVNDYRDTIKNITDLKDIPLLSIVQSNGHISGQELGWFTNVNDMDTPSCLDEFNAARESMSLDLLHDEREMFMGDHQVIPSIQEIDPIRDNLSLTTYVGLLSYLQKSKPDDYTLSQDSANEYVVCNIAATNRRRYGQEELLRNISDYLHLDVISTGELVDHAKAVERRFGSFVVSQYIDYGQILPSSRAFISYGGHGSTLNALAHGVPIIGLGPFSSEQRGTLENVQSYGAGVVIPHSTEIQSISASDMNNMKIYGNWHTSITSEQIIDAIDTFIREDSFAIRALELATKLKHMEGSVRVNDIIDGYI